MSRIVQCVQFVLPLFMSSSSLRFLLLMYLRMLLVVDVMNYNVDYSLVCSSGFTFSILMVSPESPYYYIK